MNRQELVTYIKEAALGNITHVRETVSGNIIEGYFLKATRNVKDGIILYLHGGTFNVNEKIINRFTDLLSYRVMGWDGFLLKFGDEDSPDIIQPDPNKDILEIKDACDVLSHLTSSTKVNLVSNSRGGYPGLSAFLEYSSMFNKLVCFVPPIWVENPVWFDAQADWAKKYLKQRLPSPMVLAEQGAYKGLEKRMFMITGELDATCQPEMNGDRFAKIVKCGSYIVKDFGHNAHMSADGKVACLQFLKE